MVFNGMTTEAYKKLVGLFVRKNTELGTPLPFLYLVLLKSSLIDLKEVQVYVEYVAFLINFNAIFLSTISKTYL